MKKRSSPRAAAKPAPVQAEVEIEKLGHEGDGVASVDGHDRFIPFTVPGDRGLAELAGTRGRMIALRAEGPGRVQPTCPHFGVCGGCVVQHLEAGRYRDWKRSLVITALKQRGLDPNVVAPLESVAPGTRRRVTLGFTHAKHGTHLGFHKRQSHDLIDVAVCPVACSAIVSALPTVRNALSRFLPSACTGMLHLTATETGLDLDLRFERAPSASDLVLRESLAQLAKAVDLARLSVDGEPALVARAPVVSFDGLAVRPPPGAFLQPTTEGEHHLMAWVREGLSSTRRVIDLYAGLGTLSLPLAQYAQIHAVDTATDALTALAQAAKGLPLTTERRDLARNPVPAALLKSFDGAMFDPPRAGAAAQAAALAEARVPRVVAVSCNPATFARDARLLVDRGYTLAWVRPLDQFLWSAHVELAALFLRSQG